VGRRSTDCSVTITLDKDERTELNKYAKHNNITIAALFRFAMNAYIRKIGTFSELEVRRPQGRPRKHL